MSSGLRPQRLTITPPELVGTGVQSLLAEGWQEDEDFSSVDENFAFVEFDQGEDTLYFIHSCCF